jgi:acyl-CoA reductase-like NAD-dependent aldehyde dehydrogenase
MMSADAADAGTANGAVPGTGEGDTEGQGQLEGGEQTQGQEGETPDPAAELAHWKEMARKHEKRAKENAAAAARLKTIDQANMTEVEKAVAAQREAERERDEARDMHARMMAAAAQDLPVELIDFLGTGTEEEIGERAELLASCIEETAQAIAEQLLNDKIASGELVVANGNGRNGQPQVVPGRPVESLRAGSAPAGTAPATQEQWFRQLLGQ